LLCWIYRARFIFSSFKRVIHKNFIRKGMKKKYFISFLGLFSSSENLMTLSSVIRSKITPSFFLHSFTFTSFYKVLPSLVLLSSASSLVSFSEHPWDFLSSVCVQHSVPAVVMACHILWPEDSFLTNSQVPLSCSIEK
jgi:hypothetical protein